MLTPEMKSWFLKRAASLAYPWDNINTLTFIDEFKISPVKKDYYAWESRGKPVWIFSYSSKFEISAIVEFNADGRVYFFGSRETINSEVFQFFLNKIIESEKRHLGDNQRVWCLSDNASIHKRLEVRSIFKLNNSSLMTIAAYSPCLNPTEKLIRFIKEKVKAEKW